MGKTSSVAVRCDVKFSVCVLRERTLSHCIPLAHFPANGHPNPDSFCWLRSPVTVVKVTWQTSFRNRGDLLAEWRCATEAGLRSSCLHAWTRVPCSRVHSVPARLTRVPCTHLSPQASPSSQGLNPAHLKPADKTRRSDHTCMSAAQLNGSCALHVPHKSASSSASALCCLLKLCVRR